jgi:hypothetical protein
VMLLDHRPSMIAKLDCPVVAKSSNAVAASTDSSIASGKPGPSSSEVPAASSPGGTANHGRGSLPGWTHCPLPMERKRTLHTTFCAITAPVADIMRHVGSHPTRLQEMTWVAMNCVNCHQFRAV